MLVLVDKLCEGARDIVDTQHRYSLSLSLSLALSVFLISFTKLSTDFESHKHFQWNFIE